MRRFCYDGVMEEWKVELAIQRARRKGFRDDELDDVIQDLVLELMGIGYDADHANGASERTMLTSVIDRQLGKMRRTKVRHEALEQQVALTGDEFYDNSHVELRMDVETVTGMLDDEQQQICDLLSQGYSKSAIARELGCGWHKVNRLVGEIRRHFEEHGLEED